MRASFLPLGLTLGILLGLGATETALAGDTKPVRLKTFKRTERRLDKDVDGVDYSSKTYRFSRSTKVRLKADHSIVLTVWSADFQPTIHIRKSGKPRILKHGTYDPASKHEGADWYVTRINFEPEDRGTFVITISTKDLDKGTYFLEGAIWGQAKPKPAATDPNAPSQAEASTAGFKYKPYKPFQAKRNHYVGGAYSKGGKHAAEVGVKWLEGGDTIDTLGSPTDPKSGFGKIDRREGNIYYFEPQTMGRGAKKKIYSYKIMIFHPKKELHALIRVQAAHAAAIPTFVKKAQALLAKFESKARPKQ